MSEKRVIIGAPLTVAGFIGVIWNAQEFRKDHPEWPPVSEKPLPINLWPLNEWDHSEWAVVSAVVLLMGFMMVASRLMGSHNHDHNHGGHGHHH